MNLFFGIQNVPQSNLKKWSKFISSNHSGSPELSIIADDNAMWSNINSDYRQVNFRKNSNTNLSNQCLYRSFSSRISQQRKRIIVVMMWILNGLLEQIWNQANTPPQSWSPIAVDLSFVDVARPTTVASVFPLASQRSTEEFHDFTKFAQEQEVDLWVRFSKIHLSRKLTTRIDNQISQGPYVWNG